MRTASGRPELELHQSLIRNHFERIAEPYLEFKGRNAYYHRYLKDWCRSLVPPGARVLDAGCGRGDLLAELGAQTAVGVDISPRMVELARHDHPELDFRAQTIEALDAGNEFDAALLINTLEYSYDPNLAIGAVARALRENGRLLVTNSNPLWSGIFRVSSRLGLRIPDCKRLFVTNADMRNLLELNGIEIVHERHALVLPKGIPLLAAVLNWIVPRIPILRSLCSTQLIVGRKLPARRDLSVSIVIPCYNEERNIAECVQRAPRLGSRTEIIFVDDGSKDGTSDAVRAGQGLRQDVEIRLVSYSPNRGKGNAVTEGFKAATGDLIMILDADLTTSADELDAVYEALATGRAEFVNCTRMIYPMDDRAMKVANYIGNRLFTMAVSWIIERRVTDTLCGTKAMFRRDFAFVRMGRDPWGDYDLLFGAAQLRLALREIPVHYGERKAGQSKMKALQHGLKLARICGRGFLQVKRLNPLRIENVIR